MYASKHIKSVGENRKNFLHLCYSLNEAPWNLGAWRGVSRCLKSRPSKLYKQEEGYSTFSKICSIPLHLCLKVLVRFCQKILLNLCKKKKNYLSENFIASLSDNFVGNFCCTFHLCLKVVLHLCQKVLSTSFLALFWELPLNLCLCKKLLLHFLKIFASLSKMTFMSKNLVVSLTNTFFASLIDF